MIFEQQKYNFIPLIKLYGVMVATGFLLLYGYATAVVMTSVVWVFMQDSYPGIATWVGYAGAFLTPAVVWGLRLALDCLMYRQVVVVHQSAVLGIIAMILCEVALPTPSFIDDGAILFIFGVMTLAFLEAACVLGLPKKGWLLWVMRIILWTILALIMVGMIFAYKKIYPTSFFRQFCWLLLVPAYLWTFGSIKELYEAGPAKKSKNELEMLAAPAYQIFFVFNSFVRFTIVKMIFYPFKPAS